LLQLEHFDVGQTTLDAVTMRTLSQLPSLTSLEHGYLRPDGWPLLPQLPRLQQLVFPSMWMPMAEKALARCDTLTDLSLAMIDFEAATQEECEARWTRILRSVPNLRRLRIEHCRIDPLLSVLPFCLPRLEHLSLGKLRAKRTDRPAKPLLSLLPHLSVTSS
jgi:hypothetical protein